MPAFDLPDPFKKLDPFGTSADPIKGSLISAKPARKPKPDPLIPAIQPEDAESLASKALGVGSSGINYVLGTLDKPGQAVRGALAGHGLSSLKHLLPFSDTLGLTTEKDKVSGRNLTDMYGITDKYDKGWGAWGTGLAADIATDPLTYITGGAKSAFTGTGKALQKQGLLKGMSRKDLLRGFEATEPGLLAAGKTAGEVAHEMRIGRVASQAQVDAAIKAGHEIVPGQALSSLARINVPFGPKINVGTGRAAQAFAGGLDATGDWLRHGNPLGRVISANFDHSVGGATGAATQRGWKKYGQPIKEETESMKRDVRTSLADLLRPTIDSGLHPESVVTDTARAVAEGVPHQFPADLIPAVKPAADYTSGLVQRFMSEAKQTGAPVQDLADQYAQYVRRQALAANPKDLQMGGLKDTKRFLAVKSGADIGREEVFRDIPGGTWRLNDWAKRFAANPAVDRPAVAGDITNDLVHDFVRGGGTPTPEILKTFGEKGEALAERFSKLDVKHKATADSQGLPLFSPDLVSDVTQRTEQHGRTMAAARAAIGTVGDVAVPHLSDGSTVSVPDLLRNLGLQNTGFNADTGELAKGALIEAYKALAPKGAGNVESLLKLSNGKIENALKGWGVSSKHAAEILASHQLWKAPEQIKTPLAALDSFTNAFKSLAYPIWLPSHVRNGGTAGMNNLMHGVRFRDYLDQLAIMTGRGSRDLGLTPEFAALPAAERAAALRKAQHVSAGLHGNGDVTNDVLSVLGAQNNPTINLAGGFTPKAPGAPGGSGSLTKDAYDLIVKEGLLGSAKALGSVAKGAVKDPMAFAPWNLGSGRVSNIFSPVGIKGVAGAAEDALPAVASGRKLGSVIEDFFRGAQWNHEVRTGATPEMANKAIEALHFNYDHLADFEKHVMRRLVPFYTFARRNLPLQLNTIASRPGVFSAQYRPFNQHASGEDGYVPQYLASGVAMPVGPEVDGQRQYVSKLGLPAEEAFERLHFKNGLPDVRATALDYMSTMNPILKAPLEQLFNLQFHTQRKLTDLKAPQTASLIGRTFGEDNPQILSQILANSPATRFISSADKLIDPRKSNVQKALNMLTGVRVTDVDTEKQRSIELRDSLEKMMDEHPNLSRHTRFYVKKEDAEKLTPEEVQMMGLYGEISKQAREAMKKNQGKKIGVRS